MSGEYNPGPYVAPLGIMHLVGWKDQTDRQTEYIDSLGARQTEWSEVFIFRWVNRDDEDQEDRGNTSADDVLRDSLCPKVYWTADDFQKLWGDRYRWRDGKVRSVQCKEINRVAGDLDWTNPFDPAYPLPQESLWEVLVNFTTDMEEAEEGPPEDRRPIYEWSTETIDVPLDEDVEEMTEDTPPLPIKIQNINGQYLLPEGPETLVVLKVIKYIGPGRDFPPDYLFLYANHVNKYYFFGAPPKCCLCSSIHAEEAFMHWIEPSETEPDVMEKKSAWYNRVTYVFKFKFRWENGRRVFPEDPKNITDEEDDTTTGHKMKLLHVGTLVRVKDPDLADAYTLEVPMGDNGVPKSEPVALSDEQWVDGEGYEIKDTDPDADIYKNWLYFNRYPTADFRCIEVDYIGNAELDDDPPGTLPIPVCSEVPPEPTTTVAPINDQPE